MKGKSLLTVSLVLLFGFSQPVHHHSHGSAASGQDDHSNPSAGLPSTTQIGTAIQDLLYGLSRIETAVNNGDFENASKTFVPLHDEYHAAVLPLVEAKNPALGVDMHAKFDALDSAIDNKDQNKILKAINENKENLHQAAKELGIPIK